MCRERKKERKERKDDNLDQFESDDDPIGLLFENKITITCKTICEIDHKD